MMPSAIQELANSDIELVRHGLAAACPTTPVWRVRPGPRSYANRTFIADTDEGPLLLKLPVRVRTAAHLRQLVVATRLAAEAGVPVIRFRAVHLSEQPLGVPFLVQEFIPGESAAAIWDRLRESERLSLLTKVGALVARLHRVHSDRFGVILSAHPATDLRTALHAFLDNVLVQQVTIGVDIGRFTEIVAALRTGIDALPVVRTATLVHNDLLLDNILVRDGDPVALLDFEHARWLDPIWDLVKLEELVWRRQPGAQAAFLAGYTAAAHDSGMTLDGEAGDRLRLYQGLQYLSAAVYFARWQPDLVSVYVDQLAEWLASARS